jgi:RNA recognition motif-containing protein
MPKAGEAKAAVKNLNGYKLAGNLIRVKKAETKKENTQDTTQASKPTKSKTARKEDKVADELKNNEDNILNIYGTIKKSDDEF